MAKYPQGDPLRVTNRNFAICKTQIYFIEVSDTKIKMFHKITQSLKCYSKNVNKSAFTIIVIRNLKMFKKQKKQCKISWNFAIHFSWNFVKFQHKVSTEIFVTCQRCLILLSFYLTSSPKFFDHRLSDEIGFLCC